MKDTVDILSNLKDKQGMKDLNFLLLVRGVSLREVNEEEMNKLGWIKKAIAV